MGLEDFDDDDMREHRYQALWGHASELLILLGFDGLPLLTLSPSPGILGFEVGERESPHIAERVHPQDLPLVLELLERTRRTPGFEATFTVRAEHKDGSWRSLLVTMRAALEDPRLQGAVVRVRDLSADRPTTVSAPDGRFTTLAEALPLGVLAADSAGSVYFANAVASELLGTSLDGLRGRRWLERFAAEDRDDLLAATNEVLSTQDGHSGTWRAAHEPRPLVHLRLVQLGEPGRALGWLATLEDVTARRQLELDLTHRATHDPLTGLANRTVLIDRIEQALARLAGGGREVALLFVDLDDFKAVNDRLGHAAGDHVLRTVAQRMAAEVRPTETLVRFGGDEFVLLCEATPDEVQHLHDRISAAVAEPIDVDGGALSVTVSIGTCRTADPSRRAADLLRGADEEMYRTKRDASRSARRAHVDPAR